MNFSSQRSKPSATDRKLRPGRGLAAVGYFGCVFSFLLLLGSGGGCVVSRCTEKILSAGDVEYYADFSRINEECIWEIDGRYFVQAPVVGYEYSSGWVGLFTPPLSHWFSYLSEADSPREPVWIELSPKDYQLLCTPGSDSSDPLVPPWITGAYLPQLDYDPAAARKHRILRNPEAPQIIESCCGSRVSNSTPLFCRKSPASYWLCPLLPVTLAWDIPATVVMSTGFYLIVLPLAAFQ